MRILMLSDSSSTHTQRWVQALSQKGCEILLFSLNDKGSDFFIDMPKVQLITCHKQKNGSASLWAKLSYVTALRKVNRCIKTFRPDLIHAHYASSYGLLGALATKRHRPFIISIWGSDVYEFPEQNLLCKIILKYNLRQANYILSTSHIMAKHANLYTDKPMAITPFGVDTEKFRLIPELVPSSDIFVVGNVKSLTPKYGIDVLIRSFKIVVDNNPTKKCVLEIYGRGPQREEYEQLAKSLKLDDKVTFYGFVENSKLPEIYNRFSVSVSVSNSESFGVVAVEAMACECPVITSDADGFTEVVENGITGIIVPKRDEQATAKAIQRFIDNKELRQQMGTAGRERVRQLYSWNNNVNTMLDIYRKILDNKKGENAKN